MIHFLILLFSVLHAFHLSKTEINYDVQSNSIQIASKVFIDDLESELKLSGYNKLQIGTSLEKSNVDSIIHIYFDQHLSVILNDKKLNSNFIGKELSGDLQAVWVYIEIANVENFNEVKINNTILVELFNDQQNMTIIKRNNKMIEHKMLNNKDTSCTTNF